jgi:hypothetical protein
VDDFRRGTGGSACAGQSRLAKPERFRRLTADYPDFTDEQGMIAGR